MGFSIMALVFLFLFSSCSAQQNSSYVLGPVELDAMSQICANWKAQPHQTWNGDLGSWCGSNEEPCDPLKPWFGVRCLQKQWTNDTTRWNVYIVMLVIESPHLIGTLPPSFGNLTNLASLTIEGAQNLTGPLPDLTKLRSLNSIKFGGNSLNGSIPASITSSEALQYLDLSRNKFSGEIPGDFLSKTRGLQTLDLSQNLLFGVLNQTMFQFQSSLIELDLSKNQFSGTLPNLAPSLYYLDVSNNNFKGHFPNMSLLQNIQYLNLRHNQFYGEIQQSMIFNMTLLETLDVSNNGFWGHIPNLSSLTNLKTLNLSYNNFQGENFPNWMAELTHLDTLSLDDTSIYGSLDISRLFSNASALKYLTAQNNNITDVIYNNSIKSLDRLNINLQSNPFCATATSKIDLQRCVCQQICYDSRKSATNNTKIIIIVSTISGVLFLIIIFFSALLLRKITKNKYELVLEAQKKFLEYEVKPTVFTYNELRIATKDFHPSMKLGEGGFGIVYKGFLPNGDEVAVKKLFNTIAQNDTDDFLNEVVIVTAIKHRNLVSLKGCCLKRKQRILVYEYVENYDLAQVLFEHKGRFNIDWQKRLQICIDVANGLHYLHALAEPRIIHRDVKPNNILLDKNLRAKIADFGLALLFPDEQNDILTMHVAGTRGYLAPEYATLGQLSEKVDVFSFGILILEIISGRRIIDLTLLPHQTYLLEWVQTLYENGNIMDITDPHLNLHVHEEMEVQRTIKIALCCSQLEAERRPTMARVVAMLQGDMDLEIVMSEKQLPHNDFIELSPQEELDNNHFTIRSVDMDEDSNCRPMLEGSTSSSNYSPFESYIELSEVKLR